MNELMKLKQQPIIEYDLMREEGQRIRNEIEKYKLDKLVITEENKTEIKKFRAELNKRFKKYDSMRLQIKDQVEKPYKEFEKVFNKEFKETFKTADEALKNGINQIETQQKEEKEQEARSYFTQKNPFGWLAYEQLGITIKLSDSQKSIEKEIDGYFQTIREDAEVIKLQEQPERYMAIYMETLDLPYTLKTVKLLIEQENAIKEQEAPGETPDPQTEEPKEEIKPPVEVPKKEDPKFKATFTVLGTKEQLKKLTAFMKEVGIKYEQ